jgi:hypothetical protein
MVCTVPKLVTVGTEIQTSTAGVAGATDLVTLITNAAAAISNGYTAVGVGTTLYISNVITSSADLLQTVTVVPGTGLVIGAGPVGRLTLSLSVDSVSVGLTRVSHENSDDVWYHTSYTPNTSSPINVILGGLTNAPYTYAWTLQSTTVVAGSVGTAIVITPTATNAASITFQCSRPGFLTAMKTAIAVPGGTKTVTYICSVTDASGVVTVSTPLTVIVTA